MRFWRGKLTDWTRWFDTHPVEAMGEYPGVKAARPEAWKWYGEQDLSRPIYLHDAHPEVPSSVRFPIEKVQAAFPVNGEPCRQFTCMVDKMMAFAAVEGFECVILNGIGVADDIGSQWVHRGIFYWIGFLRGMGIQVIVEGPSVYAQPEGVYGYDKLGHDEYRQIRQAQTTSRYLKNLTRDMARARRTQANLEEPNDPGQ